ncbi:MAG: 3-phosphoshikimate 1-carboxyvinyltransferase [Nitrososphaeria archaeon]
MVGLTDLVVKETAHLGGTIRAPSSKSLTHREFVAAALSDGRSEIRKALICDDTLATVEACRMLGAEITWMDEEAVEVQGRSKPLTPKEVINCRDSGSTMRFLAPVCALPDGISVLTGGESLRKRPMQPILDALRRLGVECYSALRDGRPPLVVFGGGIEGGETSIRGDVSSQFISGLLFAAPMAESDIDIVLSTPLESRPYVALTIDALRKHGVEVEVQPDYDGFHIPSGQTYFPVSHEIEGDYSSAAFILAAAAITDSHVRVENLRVDSIQGDRAFVGLLEKTGVQVVVGMDFVEVQGVKGNMSPVDVDLRENPDLVPVCAALSCVAQGMSVIRGVERLRFKESDRITALAQELRKLGAKVTVLDGAFEIEGQERLHGGELDSHGDHRIAMACVVAALRAEGASVIGGAECISKSYPDFVRDMISLGGKINER